MKSKVNESKIDDLYSTVTNTVDGDIRKNDLPADYEQSTSKPFLEKPVWSYLLAPLISILTFTALGMLLSWNPSTTWIAILIGQLLAVNLAIFRKAFRIFSRPESSLIYLAGISIFINFVSSPYALANSILSVSASPSITVYVHAMLFGIVCFSLSLSMGMLTNVIDNLKTLFGTFAPTFSSTVGYPANKIVVTTLRVVLLKTADGNDTNGLEYLKTSAQAMIDSSGTRILPWLALLTIASLGFENFFEKLLVSKISLLTPDTVNIIAPLIRLVVATVVMYLTFTVAHRTYIDVAILQAICKIQQRGKK